MNEILNKNKGEEINTKKDKKKVKGLMRCDNDRGKNEQKKNVK